MRRGSTERRVVSQSGEVSSWLIFAAGLCVAAVLAAQVLGGTIQTLASLVATAGASEPSAIAPSQSDPPGGDPSERNTPDVNPDGSFSDPELEELFGHVAAAIDKGDDLGMSNGELNDVYEHLDGLTQQERALLIARLSDAQLERIVHNLHSDSAWSNDYDDRERTKFYELLYDLPLEQKDRIGVYSQSMASFAAAERATAGNPAAAAAFKSLVSAETFRTGPDFQERTALLSAVGHYPASDAIANVERLTTRDWFKDMDLADIQRTVQSVAFLTQYTGGDAAIIDNTLDQILSDDSEIVLKWDHLGGPFGRAGNGEITLGREFLDAGNEPIDLSDSRTEHMMTHTIAHEVNHIINQDEVSESFDYFMGEYRAFYVGQQARFGSAPTTAQVRRRVRTLLIASDGPYARITSALSDPDEGPKIASFVSGIVGHEVTPENAAEELKKVDDPNAVAPTPTAVDGGPNNLENS